jgi:chromosome segregation ATPase
VSAVKAGTIIVLCAACLAAGAAVGYFAARGSLDAELRAAVAEKDRLVAEMDAAADAVRASGERLEAIRDRMAQAASEADKAASDIAVKASTIESLVARLKASAQDARGRLKELSRELESAVAANESGIDKLGDAIERAGGPGRGR